MAVASFEGDLMVAGLDLEAMGGAGGDEDPPVAETTFDESSPNPYHNIIDLGGIAVNGELAQYAIEVGWVISGRLHNYTYNFLSFPQDTDRPIDLPVAQSPEQMLGRKAVILVDPSGSLKQRAMLN